jgi:hypothetical protein
VLANDVVSVTKTIPTFGTNATLSFRSDGGGARVKSLQAWPMGSIW